jgi:phage-related protein (TIGR01555 family)
MNVIGWAKRKWEIVAAEREMDRRRARIVETNERAKRTPMKIDAMFVDRLQQATDAGHVTSSKLVLPMPKYSQDFYIPPKGLVCSDVAVKKLIASDSAFSGGGANVFGTNAMFTGVGFPGFPYLTELTEITEYRDMSERVAAEMCRKWIEFRSTGEEKRSEEIKVIEAELKRLNARQLFCEAATKDGWFGRCQIFMDLGETEGMNLKYPLLLNPFTVKKDSLRGLKVVEPSTTYPAAYNASWPLKQDYYTPSSWWVYGQEVHTSRMLTFISRPLPDLLKPVFNFSGISLSQLAEPYVNYWLSTRDSVGKLLRNFSTSVLATNMTGVLQGDNSENFIARAQLYNALRDNQGLMLLDKETEQFEKHETPLSGLDKLQAQAQEHMAAVAKTPLVILLGITPSGLNSSDEQGLRIFYDYVNDQQEKLFRPTLEPLIKVIMLTKFGRIYDDITFDFVSLMSMTEKERALIHKSDAEEAQVYVTLGVVSAEEVRSKIASDPDSGWTNLDVENVLGTLTPAAPGGAPGAGGGAPGGEREQAENVAETNAAFNSPGDARVPRGSLTMDKEFDEDLHPRDDRGKFSASGMHTVVSGTGKERKLTRMGENGKPVAKAVAERLNKLGVPPAWTKVQLNDNPKDHKNPQVKGWDGKKWQTIYTDEHNANSKVEKFGRLKDFNKALPKLRAQIDKDMKKGNDTAAMLRLVDKTGFRVGAEGNVAVNKKTGEEIKTYGASTLTGKMITVRGDKIHFDFVGKHAVHIEHDLVDKPLADYLRPRAGKAAKLFDTDDKKSLAYIKGATGNTHFKTKDFRTWNGTAKAIEAIAGRTAKTEKEFKTIQKDVATKVSQHLHNTPTIALKDYIDPTVWGKVGNFA